MSVSEWRSNVERLWLSRKKEYTNAQASRDGIFPCETDPKNGSLARLGDQFHSAAEIVVGQHEKSRRRVCMACADKWHKNSQRETLKLSA